MRIEITAKPLFSFNLTKPERYLLVQIARKHYDGRCKAAAAVGGFIYGWDGRLEEDPTGLVSATWDQIDTCLKILEMACYEDNAQAFSIANSLRSSWVRAFQASNTALSKISVVVE